MLKSLKLLGVLAAVAVAVPAGAQFVSVGYEFMQAVRERDGAKATESIRANGSAVINFRDAKGEAALHVLAARRDGEWLGFLLGAGADPNVQTSRGDTPLLIAARSGWLEGVGSLLGRGARVDLANRAGETPLIIAVQQRQVAVVKRLLEAGANPDRTDNATGRSARDYAKEDRRSAELLRLIETVKPAKAKPISGPSL